MRDPIDSHNGKHLVSLFSGALTQPIVNFSKRQITENSQKQLKLAKSKPAVCIIIFVRVGFGFCAAFS